MITSRKSIKLSLRKKFLFATITTLTFFFVLEGVLALLGVRPQANQFDRTAGFSSYLPLLTESTDEQGQVVLTTAENKLHWFNRQSFPKVKAVGTQRIFCMGGSTTYGHPYWDETSFAGWLRKTLPIVDSSQQWEVINAGGISYASYRVAALMEELAQYEPDLFIVYSAHNEFLERRTYQAMFEQSVVARDLTALLSRTRLWTLADRLAGSIRQEAPVEGHAATTQLSAEVDEELNHTIGPSDYHRDDAWRTAVISDYRKNLQRMIDVARRAHAKIVFITPAVNEQDCSPFKSEMTREVPTDLATMEALLLSGDQAFDQAQFASAAQSYRQAVKLDERYADAHYRLGRALAEQSLPNEALNEFRRAIDEDVCPLRAITEIDSAIRSIAQTNKVPLVDFGKRLRTLIQAQTGSPILGNEAFLDHVHPSIEVNRQLSHWIIEQLQQEKWIGGKTIRDSSLEPQLEEIRQETYEAIDRDDEIFAIRNLAKVLHWSGKFAEAIPRARDVLDLAPGDPESRYIVASCLANLGRNEEALEEYDVLFADGIGFPRAYQPYGELLAAQGHYEQAKAYLLLAVLRSPDSADVYTALGHVHQQLGEDEFAAEAFATAEKLKRPTAKGTNH